MSAKEKKQKQPKAQNRIDYIVYGNPRGARKLMDRHGYIPPNNLQDVSRAVKLLVKQKGKPFIKELLQIHPEKEAILNAAGKSTTEDSYCGCSASSFTGGCGCKGSSSYNTKSSKAEMEIDVGLLLSQMSFMTTADLEKALSMAKEQQKKNPSNKELSSVIDAMEKHLEQRKGKKNDPTDKQASEKDKEDSKKDPFYTDKNFLMGLGAGLVLTMLLVKLT